MMGEKLWVREVQTLIGIIGNLKWDELYRNNETSGEPKFPWYDIVEDELRIDYSVEEFVVDARNRGFTPIHIVERLDALLATLFEYSSTHGMLLDPKHVKDQEWRRLCILASELYFEWMREQPTFSWVEHDHYMFESKGLIPAYELSSAHQVILSCSDLNPEMNSGPYVVEIDNGLTVPLVCYWSDDLGSVGWSAVNRDSSGILAGVSEATVEGILARGSFIADRLKKKVGIAFHVSQREIDKADSQ